jgi:uncharacterized membrane protein HdeD (DUF308 family)
MMARNRWSLALRGVAAIIFGVATWQWSDLTLLVFVLLFGIFAIADGLFNIAGAVALAWVISAYAVLYGLLCLLLSFRLRETRRLAVSAPSEA